MKKKKELKSSKSLAKKKNSQSSSEKFLLKKGSQYLIVNRFLVETLPFQEAIFMAESTYFGLKDQLYVDAVNGDHFVQGMRVVDALQVGLNALYSKHPILREYVRDCSILKSDKQKLV